MIPRYEKSLPARAQEAAPKPVLRRSVEFSAKGSHSTSCIESGLRTTALASPKGLSLCQLKIFYVRIHDEKSIPFNAYAKPVNTYTDAVVF